MQQKIVRKRRRQVISRFLHSKVDKETIAVWRLNLNTVLIVFAFIQKWLITGFSAGAVKG